MTTTKRLRVTWTTTAAETVAWPGRSGALRRVLCGGGWPVRGQLRSRRGPRRRCCLMVFLLVLGLPPVLQSDPVTSSSPMPAGPLGQAECADCHAARDPVLVGQWRAGPHAGVACVACHGERHGRLPSARADQACSSCHDGVVTRSYATSKHGVLIALERPAWDRPLARGNYRAPGCAYCHQHAADHGDSMDATRGPAVREWVCAGCHAPRFVADQFAAGDELLAIGQLKAGEARAVAGRHPRGASALGDLLGKVNEHLRNLRLGAGHQSPDYQWWHGQPALDGDLIRLRDAVAGALRKPVPSAGGQ